LQRPQPEKPTQFLHYAHWSGAPCACSRLISPGTRLPALRRYRPRHRSNGWRLMASVSSYQPSRFREPMQESCQTNEGKGTSNLFMFNGLHHDSYARVFLSCAT
jgi:hypothetical protein